MDLLKNYIFKFKWGEQRHSTENLQKPVRYSKESSKTHVTRQSKE